MFAFIKAMTATLLIAEISGAFALGVTALFLLAVHVHVDGVFFWSIEALVGAAVIYGCSVFFMRALAYERAAAKGQAIY